MSDDGIDFVAATNALYLLAHPEIARKARANLRAERRKRAVIVLALKPKYAKAIYEGKKNWEFRKAPPPTFREMFVYESEPVSAITGTITFCETVTGVPFAVWHIVKTNKCFTRNLTGISLEALEAYSGKRLVTALRVLNSKRFEEPVKIKARPPQNWGRYYLPRNAVATESEATNAQG